MEWEYHGLLFHHHLGGVSASSVCYAWIEFLCFQIEIGVATNDVIKKMLRSEPQQSLSQITQSSFSAHIGEGTLQCLIHVAAAAAVSVRPR